MLTIALSSDSDRRVDMNSGPRTVTSALTEALRQRILAGEFSDGSQIRQGVIASEYQVSRMPVREAFQQLAAEGFINISPHKTATVPNLSIDEISEFFELRALLESNQIVWAIPHMKKQDIERAQSVLDEFDQSLNEGGAVQRWGELNWKFHRTLYLPAGRPKSLKMIENLHYHTDRHSRIQLLFTDWRSKAQLEHRAILEYCRKGAKSDAAEYLRQHITSAGEALVCFLNTRQVKCDNDAHPADGPPLCDDISRGP